MEWYHVCWPRLTAKRVEPVVSISWASCLFNVYKRFYFCHVFTFFNVFLFFFFLGRFYIYDSHYLLTYNTATRLALSLSPRDHVMMSRDHVMMSVRHSTCCIGCRYTTAYRWYGLTPSVLGQDRSETKKIGLGLGLAGLVSCCETRSCHARRHNDLEAHSNFSSTIYSFSILCLEHHYCGDQQLAFTYLKVKSAKCVCLLLAVLVLLFWSWSWS